MLKGAWILPALMLAALIIAALYPFEVSAAERNGINWAQPAKPQPPQDFKDLPGVAAEDQRAKQPEYTCTTDIEEVYRSRGDFRMLYGDTRPTRLYHCTGKNGVTFTSTQMPNTEWVPGLNPHDLPR